MIGVGRLLALFVLALAAGSGCTSKSPEDAKDQTLVALAHMKAATFYSLDPKLQFDKNGVAIVPCRGCLYGYRILGKIEVSEARDLKGLRSLLTNWLTAQPDEAAMCVIEPRQAVSFVADGVRHEMLLCYHCAQATLYHDGLEVAPFIYGDHPKGEAFLKDLLTRAKVPLASEPSP